MGIDNNQSLTLNPSVFNYSAKNKQLKYSLKIFAKKFKSNISHQIKKLENSQCSTIKKIILIIIFYFRRLTGINSKEIEGILESQREITNILHYYNKAKNLNPKSPNIEKLPYVFTAGKLNEIATKYQFKAIKAQAHSTQLNLIQNSFTHDQKLEKNITENEIFKQIKLMLNNIAEIYGNKNSKLKNELLNNFNETLKVISKMTNEEGHNVIQQLSNMYKKKSDLCSNISKLYVTKEKLENHLKLTQEEQLWINSELSTLGITSMEQGKLTNVSHAIAKLIEKQQNCVKNLDEVFEDFINKIHDDLSIYQISSERLAEKFSDQVLKKPVDVTMIGIEYSGLVKEGGLAEALEGMTKAMSQQHPDNKVRLIFPKYSILPSNIQDQLNLVTPTTHKNSNGYSYQVYTHVIDKIEYHFIDDPIFTLKEKKPSIYDSDVNLSKELFSTFSGLAADYVKEIKTDVIHLHDWHVAGVALKLHQNTPQKDIPPIVFTFHNNGRASQGFGQGAYNYDPVIQGLIKTGIATENLNIFVETLKKADAITTVSETYGLESQDLARGEGVSFATREVAEMGKMTGIINGSNPHSWNPEKDTSLKAWKDPETGQSIDLTYGPSLGNLEIVEKKEQCKTQLKKWVNQNFPNSKLDFTKPIVTYLGRLDSYQKGLDKLEEAIDETIKNGGQFVIMGSLEDSKAKEILNKLEKKYQEKVLFIRDYKDANGKYHYQQGDANRQGCGSLVRGASDFLFIPSKFEPCGLVQFEGWLFGSLAIGSNVGGLADTIISPQKNAGKFNGFLFDRESKDNNSLGSAIQTALKKWHGYSQEEKGSVMRRLILDGRKYSWSTSPSGYSPIEKYRFVYENAIKFAAQRAGKESPRFVDLTACMRKIDPKTLFKPLEVSQLLKKEEAYHQAFYKNNHKFEKLEAMYSELPKSIRQSLPTPYGRDVNSKTYEEFGAHIRYDSNNLPTGVQFTVDAPNAKQVEVKILDQGKSIVYPLTKTQKGSWTGFIPNLAAGTKYQYLVNNQIKLDPLGLSQALNPNPDLPSSSVVVDRKHEWQDKEWMASRIQNAGKPAPTSIYEVHPLYWKKKDGKFLNYREVADELVKHCKKVGYTHVELMGILEYPKEDSWGYRVTGFFAPNSRMGSPEDFKYLIEVLHKNQIGVYLDWIPAHFAKDKHALEDFDGTNSYKPSLLSTLFSLRYLRFSKWGTHFFDYTKKSVRDFLTSSACYWLKEMHIDGLRVDAIKCILSSEDLTSSRRFLKDLNAVVHNEIPGTMMIAEDYTGLLETTKSLAVNGLGFDQKWNIAWMKDSLAYFSQNPKNRSNFYDKIISAIDSDDFHKMILAISHDEVAERSKALFEKTSHLTNEEKFANLRSFFGYLMSVPGKKLMFMGIDTSLAQGWDKFIGKDIGVMQVEMSEDATKTMEAFQQLNKIYKAYKPFWQHDDNAKDLTWIEKNDPKKKIHAYRRTSDEGESIACLHNFSDSEEKEFVVMFENKEILKALQTSALSWKTKNISPQENKLSPEEVNELSFLSRYPHIARKIMGIANKQSNKQLLDDFFSWVLKDKKEPMEFLENHGWKNLKLTPQEIFNSDDKAFGGQERTNPSIESILDSSGAIAGYKVRIPPLSNVYVLENGSVQALS